MEFAMGYARTSPSQVIPWVEENQVPLMTNIRTRYGKTGFNPLYQYDTPRIIDSAGFGILNSHGTYPWTVADYHSHLSQYSDRFEWAAVMDYPCEEQFDDKFSVEERIDMTVENTIEHFNQDPEYELLPVLQGRLLYQYLECYDRLKDHGIPVDKVGIGSVCRISSSDKIVWLEEKLREETNIDWMHGFGVKITAFQKGATFESADSSAWIGAHTRGMVYNDGRVLEMQESDADTPERAFKSFKAYYRYVKEIVDQRDYEKSGKLLNPGKKPDR